MTSQGQAALIDAIHDLDDIVAVVDAAGVVVYANRRALDQLQIVLGDTACWDALPPALAARMHDVVGRAIAEQSIIEFTERAGLRSDWIDFRFHGHGERVVMIGRVANARVIREQLAEFELRLARPDDRSVTAEEILARAAAEFRLMAGWDVAEAWLLLGHRQWRLTALVTSGRPGLAEFESAMHNQHFDVNEGLPGRAAHAGHSIYIDGLTADHGFARAEISAAAGLRAALVLPVPTSGPPVAVLGFLHATPFGDDPSRAMIEAFLPRLGELIAHARELEMADHLFQLSLDGMVVAGTDKYFRRVNPAFCQMIGRTQVEVLEQPWEHWIHPDDLVATEGENQRLVRGLRTTAPFENRYRHADGSWRRLAWVVYPDAARELVYGTVRDVTEERRTTEIEALHRDALEHLARRAPLTEILADLVRSSEVLVPDAIGSILLLRDGCLHLGAAGALPADYLTAIEGEPIGPSAGSCGTAAWRDAVVITTDIAQDPLWDGYRDLALVHGLHACWSIPFHTAAGAVAGTVAVYPDSARAPNAAQLATMETIARLASVAVEHRHVDDELRLLQAAIENLHDLVMVTDAEPVDDLGPRIRFVNRAFERVTGWSRAEVIGRSPSFLQGPRTDRATMERVQAAMAHLQPIREELECVRRDGTPLWIEMDISPVADETGAFTHWVAVDRDITERRQLEEQLRESQKLEAVGRLAGGIAHDFNNMLTAILGFAELLSLELASATPAAQSHLQEIQRAAARSAELTRKLLAFSRKQLLQPRTVDLSDVVREISTLLSRIVGEPIHQTLHLANEQVCVTVDPGQLEQVLLNLVINAKEAMPEGGSLQIETAAVQLSTEYAAQHVGVEAGTYGMLSVTDTGVGISSEVRARIFEPFFTTKAEQGGTGLGLSTVIGIVSQSGGHIVVESEPGAGTTMTVYFPLVATAPTPSEPGAVLATETGSGTILLVEDEELLRSLVTRIFTRAGFTVLAAPDGETALHLTADHVGPIDLLLTDMVLPGINGRAVADGVKALRPTVRVLYMSGYTEDAIVHHGVLDEGIEFLEKPFSRQDLLARVTAILTAR
jgi:PAS domain S-box-containing protein